MNLSDLKINLIRFQQENPCFEFELIEGADQSIFESAENRLGLIIPEKTREFFKVYNGIRTKNPFLTILGVEDWTRTENGLIHFATFNQEVKIYFDSSKINQTNQWTIKNPAAHYELTLTISSFWSNKIWHWIRNRREIWKDEYWIK